MWFTYSICVSFSYLLSFLLCVWAGACMCKTSTCFQNSEMYEKLYSEREALPPIFFHVISIPHISHPPIYKYLISLISCAFFWCFFFCRYVYILYIFFWRYVYISYLNRYFYTSSFSLLSYTKMSHTIDTILYFILIMFLNHSVSVQRFSSFFFSIA